MSRSFTVGCDPEFFIKKNGVVVPSQGIIPGTKEKPFKLSGGAVHRDNVMGEFNVDPASSKQEWIDNVMGMLETIDDLLSRHDATIEIESHHEFDMEALNAVGDEAFIFGCDPDFDAWNLEFDVEAPNPFSCKGMRTAGGHIHIGYLENYDVVSRAADVFIGLPSVMKENDSVRKSMYGGAGRIRHKPYGFEYRTPSNFWIKSEKMVAWMYDRVQSLIENHSSILDIREEEIHEVKHAINTGNKEMALHYMNRFNAGV